MLVFRSRDQSRPIRGHLVPGGPGDRANLRVEVRGRGEALEDREGQVVKQGVLVNCVLDLGHLDKNIDQLEASIKSVTCKESVMHIDSSNTFAK